MGWLLRNWHLKLGALALAMILYTGIVYSGSFRDRTWDQPIPVQTVNRPDNTYLFDEGLTVVAVDYRVANELLDRVGPDTFRATVDLAEYDLSRPGEPQSLQVTVTSSLDIQVLDWRPSEVTVRLDLLTEKLVPVIVDRGDLPDGLEAGEPDVSVRQVEARGPRSRLNEVDAALARVRIDPSGLDVTAQVDLVPIDVDGEVVEPIDLSPSSTIVEIEVRQIETNRTLPIAWDLQGTPADGYTIRSVTADPAVVTVRGDPANLIGLAQIPTRPISIEGANENRTFTAQLILPQGVRVVQAEEVTLAVEIAADLGSRTFVVGVVCVDAAPGSSCLPQLDRLSVTLQGPVAALNALTPGDITPFVSAGGIASGSRRAQPAFVLPDGISIVSVSPADVLLTVVGPATPPPTPAPEPPAAP